MSSIDYSEKIPNNVNLANDRTLQRALEHWQPRFLEWWREMGPNDFASVDVYLRTAVGVDAQGWAHYGTVKMPDYRWGIFLADPIADRTIGFGDSFGQPVWQQVPGEFRSQFRRLIVTQGDTEPASVEQQHRLGHTCPSLYDLRNLFQINVEEGRHLWAMVYILHAYFGRDGREEGDRQRRPRSDPPPGRGGSAAVAALSQFLVQLLARSLRVGSVVERREHLCERNQGTAGRNHPIPGPRVRRFDLRDRSAGRQRRSHEGHLTDAQCHERSAARRLHQGLRNRIEALEHADQARRLQARAEVAEQPLPPRHRCLGERSHRPRWTAH